MGSEWVQCIDGEGGCVSGGGVGGSGDGGGWGGRHCSGSGTLFLGGSLRWNRLHLWQHGGVVDVVGSCGGNVFGGVVDVVVVNALFIAGNFLV